MSHPSIALCALALAVAGCASNGDQSGGFSGSLRGPWDATKGSFSSSWNRVAGLFRDDSVEPVALAERKPADKEKGAASTRAAGSDETDLERVLAHQTARAAAQEQQSAVESQVVKSWLRSAEAGNPLAQVVVASLYENGTGVSRDLAKAASWYERAAEQGYHRAQHHLGRMYHFGLGVPEDQATAARWLRMAGDQGDAQAQGLLALLYLEGRGVPQNYQQAYMWASVAATGDARVARLLDEEMLLTQPESIRDELRAETARQNAEVQQWAKDIREAAARQLPPDKLSEAQKLAAAQWEELNAAADTQNLARTREAGR